MRITVGRVKYDVRNEIGHGHAIRSPRSNDPTKRRDEPNRVGVACNRISFVDPRNGCYASSNWILIGNRADQYGRPRARFTLQVRREIHFAVAGFDDDKDWVDTGV